MLRSTNIKIFWWIVQFVRHCYVYGESVQMDCWMLELMVFSSAIVQPKLSSLGLTMKLIVCGEVRQLSEDGAGIFKNILKIMSTWPYFMLTLKLPTMVMKKSITSLIKLDFKWLKFWCWKMSNVTFLPFYICFDNFQHWNLSLISAILLGSEW